jgi:hypothetical protein
VVTVTISSAARKYIEDLAGRAGVPPVVAVFPEATDAGYVRGANGEVQFVVRRTGDWSASLSDEIAIRDPARVVEVGPIRVYFMPTPRPLPERLSIRTRRGKLYANTSA